MQGIEVCDAVDAEHHGLAIYNELLERFRRADSVTIAVDAIIIVACDSRTGRRHGKDTHRIYFVDSVGIGRDLRE